MDFKITEQQKRIIEAREDNVCVLASAGTSKTFCLIERIKWLVEQGTDPKKIIAITFTRNAATEIVQRLAPIQIGYCGTIHAYANYLLLLYGVDTKTVIEKEKFDEFFELVKDHPGCLEDIDIEHLLLDEAQDSGYNQFEFIFDMLCPRNWTVFGDMKQSIYEFNGGDPKLLQNLSNYSWVTTYNMNENFRNSRQVHGYAQYLLGRADKGYTDNSKLMRGIEGKVITFEYNLEILADYVKSFDTFGDWFVLCRTNKEAEAAMDFLSHKGIPCDTFKQGDLTYDELQSKMRENNVKFLTMHASKGLQRKNVAVIGARMPGQRQRVTNKAAEEVRLAYVAATRAENMLLWLKPVATKKEKSKMSNWE